MCAVFYQSGFFYNFLSHFAELLSCFYLYLFLIPSIFDAALRSFQFIKSNFKRISTDLHSSTFIPLFCFPFCCMSLRHLKHKTGKRVTSTLIILCTHCFVRPFRRNQSFSNNNQQRGMEVESSVMSPYFSTANPLPSFYY